jgi:hypothetical protein
LVDASLVHAAAGAEADPGVLDLVAVKVRRHDFLCARSALTRPTAEVQSRGWLPAVAGRYACRVSGDCLAARQVHAV